MRIGIDAHFVGVRYGGNEEYFGNLIRALRQHAEDGQRYYVFSYRGAAAPLVGRAGVEHVPLRRRAVWWQRAVELPWHTRKLALDALHVPFNFLPVSGCRIIVTIHDVGFLHLAQAYAPLERLRMRLLTALAAQRAAHVLTVSEFAKEDIVRHYGVSPDHVTATHGGPDRTVFRPLPVSQVQTVRERLGLVAPYLLFVGMIQERKNLIVLLQALETLRARGAEAQLVLVGRPGFRAERVFAHVRERGLDGAVRYLGPVPAGDLAGLYNGALGFVFPSLFEGLGLPVLEAMACGCPVVCSSTTALPEVCGDAALLFDPRDPVTLTAHLERVMQDGELRQNLIDKGFANCERYSWERTAAVVAGVYRAA